VEPLDLYVRDLVPQANIFIGVETTSGDRVSDVEFHKHDVDEIYCLLGDITMEIQIEDEKLPPLLLHPSIFPAVRATDRYE